MTSGVIDRGCILNQRQINDCAKNNETCTSCAAGGETPCNTQYTANDEHRKCYECLGTKEQCPYKQNDYKDKDKYSVFCSKPDDQCTIVDKGNSVYWQTCVGNVGANETSKYTSNMPCNINLCNGSAARNISIILVAFALLFLNKVN